MRNTFSLLLIAALTTLPIGTVQASYVYQLTTEMLPGEDPSDNTTTCTVTGIIVTDKNSGELNRKDVLFWQWWATDASIAFESSSADKGAEVVVLGNVIATPAEIYLPVVTSESVPNELSMEKSPFLFWYVVNLQNWVNPYNQYVQVDYSYSTDWFTTVAGGTLVIATASSALVGDINGDLIVNGQDLALVSSNWLLTGPSAAGDVNGDGIVNTQDLALVSASWLNTANVSAGVPEPSTRILAALGGLALLANRRRHTTR